MRPFAALLSALFVFVVTPPLLQANVVDRSVAIVNEEPGTKAGARPASTQDAKIYEGFNQ